jgi:hypothetical protein
VPGVVPLTLVSELDPEPDDEVAPVVDWVLVDVESSFLLQARADQPARPGP